uniref:FAD-binding protein n=1 Tax=Phenylobacterium glaciei TaxID=2803784 RepID=A0A974S859_9CAUL|nr:FAD-binding protein [Phenylobacterium glaciei]
MLLSLAKFSAILEIDALARTARVQPGVRNLAISEAVAHLGLFYAPDPSSQIACSIGGNVAENAGGVHCLKYGLTVHNLLKLEMVTLEGEVLHLGSDAYDAPGFDLMALMTGSEGLLGIVTEITVKLTPLPETTQVLLAAFDDVAVAAQAVAEIIAEGHPCGTGDDGRPGPARGRGLRPGRLSQERRGHPAVRTGRRRPDVAEEIARVSALLSSCGATEVRLARDEDERKRFWAGRKGAFPPWGGSRRTITAWTARSPGVPCPMCSPRSPGCRRSMGWRWPMSSTPGTATCTR